MRDLFFAAVVLLATVLLILDGWPQVPGADEPTQCSDEDVPVLELHEWLDGIEKRLQK